MLNIILFGPPGAGKGTQAARLIEKYGFNHISTGEVIREEIRKGSPMGLSVKEYIDKGHLAPDELVIGIIADYVGSQNDFFTKQFGKTLCNRSQRKFRIHFALGSAHVGAENGFCAMCHQILNGGQCADNTLVIGDHTVFHGNVKVASYKHPLAGYVNVFDRFLVVGHLQNPFHINTCIQQSCAAVRLTACQSYKLSAYAYNFNISQFSL